MTARGFVDDSPIHAQPRTYAPDQQTASLPAHRSSTYSDDVPPAATADSPYLQKYKESLRAYEESQRAYEESQRAYDESKRELETRRRAYEESVRYGAPLRPQGPSAEPAAVRSRARRY